MQLDCGGSEAGGAGRGYRSFSIDPQGWIQLKGLLYKCIACSCRATCAHPAREITPPLLLLLEST